jgi:hypothetical protein
VFEKKPAAKDESSVKCHVRAGLTGSAGERRPGCVTAGYPFVIRISHIPESRDRNYSGPEVGFEEIAIDLLQARFWIVPALPRSRHSVKVTAWILPYPLAFSPNGVSGVFFWEWGDTAVPYNSKSGSVREVVNTDMQSQP